MRALSLLVVSCPFVLSLPPSATYQNGVSMGGWLLTEPSWMFDKFSAPAEGDLVAKLRAAGGDSFAVATMVNHWAGYIPDAALDALAAFGVTNARIPVGFWIFEAPVVPVPALSRAATPYDTGFNHEGFATGGLKYLELTLAKLKARGIRALVDVHALPGGASSCQSYAGWQVSQPLFWSGTPPASNSTPVTGSCGGAGPYYTTRGSGATWMAVGEAILHDAAAWVANLEAEPTLAGSVVGLEPANEPGLGFSGVQVDIQRFFTAVVPPLQRALPEHVNVTLNFIGPNDVGTGAWVASQVASGAFDGTRLIIDFHQYYNWDGDKTWQELAAMICGTTAVSSPWAQYTAAGLTTVIGEWSTSTNLGATAYTNITNPDVVARLRTLYANEMSLFAARGGSAPGAVGQHHWALRMGSGWDPRPTKQSPQGAQAPGSAWDKSLPGFGVAVWNLGELIRVGVAQPIAALNITAVCACNGCSTSG